MKKETVIKTVKIIAAVIMFIYILVLILILFRSSSRAIDFTLEEYIKSYTNFIPFKTIGLYISMLSEPGRNTVATLNLFGNLLLFVPFGMLVPTLSNYLSKFIPYSLILFITLISVETLQLVLRRGNFDVDDIILNAIGAFVSFAIWKLLVGRLFQKPEETKELIRV